MAMTKAYVEQLKNDMRANLVKSGKSYIAAKEKLAVAKRDFQDGIDGMRLFSVSYDDIAELVHQSSSNIGYLHRQLLASNGGDTSDDGGDSDSDSDSDYPPIDEETYNRELAMR